MQNRYAGDIGDYVKFAILRALTPGHRVGVAWWLFRDEEHNDDGKHVRYLENSDEWGKFDPELFRALKGVVDSGLRNVNALEKSGILLNACYVSDLIPSTRDQRLSWFNGLKAKLDDCDVVFIDPDNGLEPDHPKDTINGKSITFAELRGLDRDGRTLIVYHHQTRRKGGHLKEIGYQADRLRSKGFRAVDALRAQPFSPRVFFIPNARDEIRARVKTVVEKWKGRIQWYPDPTESSMAANP